MNEGLLNAEKPEYASLAQRIGLRLNTVSGKWTLLGRRTAYGSVQLEPLA
jgi:hypothetical protein